MQQSLPDHFAYLLKDAKRKGKNLTKSISKEKAKKQSKESNQTGLNANILEPLELQQNHDPQQQQNNQHLQNLLHEDFTFKSEEKSLIKQDHPGKISVMMDCTEQIQKDQEQNKTTFELQEKPSSLMWKREKHLQTIDLPKKRHVENAFQISTDLFLYELANDGRDQFCNEKSYLNVPLGAFKKVRSATKYNKEGRVELAVWSDGEATQSWKKQNQKTSDSSLSKTSINSSGQDNNLNNISDVILSGLTEHAGIKLQQLISQTDFNQYVYAVNFGVDPVTSARGINMVYYSSNLLQLLGIEGNKNLHNFNGVIDLLQLISPQQNQHQEVKVKIIKQSQEISENSETLSTPSNLDFSSSGIHPLVNEVVDSIIPEDQIQEYQGNDNSSQIITINTSDFMQFKNLDEAKSAYLQQLNMKNGYLRTLDGISVEVEVSHCIEDLGEDYLAMFPETDIALTAPKFVVSLYKLTIPQESILKIKSSREALAPECFHKKNNITTSRGGNDEQMKVFLDRYYEKSIKE